MAHKIGGWVESVDVRVNPHREHIKGRIAALEELSLEIDNMPLHANLDDVYELILSLITHHKNELRSQPT